MLKIASPKLTDGLVKPCLTQKLCHLNLVFFSSDSWLPNIDNQVRNSHEPRDTVWSAETSFGSERSLSRSLQQMHRIHADRPLELVPMNASRACRSPKSLRKSLLGDTWCLVPVLKDFVILDRLDNQWIGSTGNYRLIVVCRYEWTIASLDMGWLGRPACNILAAREVCSEEVWRS